MVSGDTKLVDKLMHHWHINNYITLEEYASCFRQLVPISCRPRNEENQMIDRIK